MKGFGGNENELALGKTIFCYFIKCSELLFGDDALMIFMNCEETRASFIDFLLVCC